MHLEFQDNIAIVTLQGGRANAIDATFLQGLSGLLDTVAHSPARAVVLTGYDKFFSAGLALPALIDLDRPTMTEFITRFHDAMVQVFALPLPVIAAINGHAIAGGCVLALQADVRVMAAGPYRIGLNEAQLGIGLPPVVTEPLRCQVPAASLGPIALQGLLLLPDEALALGLVNQVVPQGDVVQVAMGVARERAQVGRPAYAQIKAALRRPAQDAMARQLHDQTEGWLDTWFSEPARTRLVEAVAKLQRKAS